MAISINSGGDFVRDIRIHCLKDIQDVVGKNIEIFGKVKHGGKDYTLLADEDGILREAEPNEFVFNKYEMFCYGDVLLVDERELKIKEKYDGQ